MDREARARSTRIANDPARADLREHDRRARARRPHARPRRARSTASAARRMNDAASSRRSSARWRRSSPRSATRSRRTRSSSRASRRSTTRARRPSSRPSSSAWPGCTTRTSCAPARSSTPAARSALAEINQRLAHALHDVQPERARRRGGLRRSSSSKEADLAGLPESVRDGAPRPPPRRAGTKGKWAITNTRSCDGAVPHLLRPPRPAREGRGACSSTAATTATRTTTTRSSPRSSQLRAERAKLLGYPTHAHWRLENTMAKTPERAMELMEAVWTPAVARVREEVADMQAIADAEKARASRSSRGTTATTPRRCARRSTTSTRTRSSRTCSSRSCARACSGSPASCSASRSRRSPACPSYHPDVRVWEVKDATSGKHVGLWYFDPYARAGQALGRVDERLPQPGALRRRGHDDRLEQLELREGQAGRAGAHQLGRREHAVPRVRPRAARPAART